MIGQLETGFGFWNAIVFVVAFVVIALIVYITRSFGEKTYKKGTEQTKPFLAGNPELSKEMMQIKAGNVYWGFTEALRGYYKPAVKTHTGIINDYIHWFVITLAVLLVLIGVLS